MSTMIDGDPREGRSREQEDCAVSSVDVVVPCYRYGHFLRECVESVLNQSGVNVRVFIIDNASPDNTAEVSAALVNEDPRVGFIRHSENKGHIPTYLQKRLGGYRRELPHTGDMEMRLRFAADASVAFISAYQGFYRRHRANMSTTYHNPPPAARLLRRSPCARLAPQEPSDLHQSNLSRTA
jgi:Glycosyl transferase family 2